jgi:hypothetical protein
MGGGLMAANDKPLPAQFETFVSFLSEQARISPELIREILVNVYRQGYADGRLDGTQAALDAATAEFASRQKAAGEA